MRISLAFAACLAAAPALADEVWRSDTGDIVYLADRNGAAILTFTNVDASAATLIVPGLAGNFDRRGTHPGFWIGEGAGNCAAILRHGDLESRQWGRAIIVFDRPGFPTSFTMILGACFDAPDLPVRAEAVPGR